MKNHTLKSNVVTLRGEIICDKEFSHEVYGEGFYKIFIETPRLSDTCDCLPLTISERLLYDFDTKIKPIVSIEGQLRSYNKYIDGSNRLILTVFVRTIKADDENKTLSKNPNEIYLDGYVCRKPIYRETPFGREITDLLIAVNRSYNKSDYIPCIAWGRNARFTAKLNVGDRIKIWVRIQSRKYQKKLQGGDVLDKVAYEVSISKMEKG
ncbi:MAG: single-stranded DNA-binding protein [Clostridiales bacterium]|nr:single-stranded DNA-binding protein [Clostridiales bacterium]